MKAYLFLAISMFTLFAHSVRAEVIYETRAQELQAIAEGQAYEIEEKTSNAFSELISVMDRIGASSTFMKEASAKLRSVIFKELPDDVGGAYNALTKTIYLPLHLRDQATGGLKQTNLLSDMSIGTIYHEMWHAYLDLVAKQSRGIVYQTYTQQMQRLYTSRGADFHNEAYGIFLDQIMINFMQLRRIMEKKTPEVRERLRQSTGMKKIYEDSFNQVVRGYYFDQWRRQFVESKVNLPQLDRQNIVNNLLKDLPPFNYADAFKESTFNQSL